MYSQFIIPNRPITAVRVLIPSGASSPPIRPSLGQIFDQSHANAVVLALSSGQFGSVTVLQNVIFMRQYLHGLLLGHRVINMIADKDADACFGVRAGRQALPQALDNGA